MFLWVLSLFVLVSLCLGIFLSLKYRNPYKWTHVVGFPGSGKTTLCVKLTQMHLKKGWTVYSNIKIPGAYLIDPDDLGRFFVSPKSLLILDEIGTVWDNRNYANFKQHSRDWAKYHRHFRHKVYSFSQSMDYDSKLRSITDKLYLLVNFFGWFSVAKEIKMRWVAVQPDANTEGRIAMAMVIQPFILAPFGARIYTFIPRWVKYFDSFDTKDLPKKEYELIQYPAKIPKRFIPKNLRNSNLLQTSDSMAPAELRSIDKDLFQSTEPPITPPRPAPLDPADESAATGGEIKGAATELEFSANLFSPSPSHPSIE